VDWEGCVWPEGEKADRRRILAALRAVVEPDPKDWSDPQTMVQVAVGNPHRGSLYPAAVPMTDLLLLIAREYPGRPRAVALNVLEDWWGLFEVEPKSEAGVIPAIVERITAARPFLESIPDAEDLLEEMTRDWTGEAPPSS
jgi:hypothetical protein